MAYTNKVALQETGKAELSLQDDNHVVLTDFSTSARRLNQHGHETKATNGGVVTVNGQPTKVKGKRTYQILRWAVDFIIDLCELGVIVLL
ncbi:hypothetical protein BaRGS_00020545 [Batillaria attramentaria]|uniref:30S ribosomal protein S4e n=1 Tax=Batillaria attramentaria TaxID=370345 RepID=A0ABD0KMI6_9CAEN